MHFPVYQINDDDFDDFEDMGTKSKFWYTDSVDGKQYLFKSTHTEDKRGNPIVRQGEDWAEKIACELAKKLGLPHAEYDLANHNGEQGTRSLNFSQKGDSLTFGNTLLEQVFKTSLPEDDKGTQRVQELKYVAALCVIEIVSAPKAWRPTANIKSAFAVFIGYVMFDCLISNQDRHNQNWGMVTDTAGNTSLAPSFDHAASLGRNESDQTRQTKLTTKDKNQTVESYVKKCKSHFYNQGERLKTFEAYQLLSCLAPSAAVEWIERLEAITDEDIKEIVDAVPEAIMSDLSKQFCTAILKANSIRIIEFKDFLLETYLKP
ncbi:HipA domain-containing protein [Vibrio plantisponsor]|uniref:HipA domain-containing protein n=1 Tax=Vibrio plantisponsor TaxID=664643 RepID=A0ABU4IMV8_9VIBR|nr:HipA domain-containing protein [Vibrio plantisponsor]MDW6019910.1 HipA domain-containing protein [Vibrio plantisponsor]NNM38761.1 hypothetical protein [Vibrio plantisponsor]